jgi:hypothetical protein
MGFALPLILPTCAPLGQLPARNCDTAAQRQGRSHASTKQSNQAKGRPAHRKQTGGFKPGHMPCIVSSPKLLQGDSAATINDLEGVEEWVYLDSELLRPARFIMV